MTKYANRTADTGELENQLGHPSLKGRAAEGAREVVEINGRRIRSRDREQIPGSSCEDDVVTRTLHRQAAKVPAYFVNNDRSRI